MNMLEDDISADLDLAMLVRRENIPGKGTPEGILTRFSTTALGRMVKAIEARPDPATIDLGFTLLTLDEDTVLEVSAGIDQLAKQGIADGKNHDVTVGLGSGGTGLTIHCNDDPIEVAGPTLQRHCHARKYTEHAQTWFGVCVRPSDQALRFGLNLNFPWEQDDAMNALTKSMDKPGNLRALLREAAKARVKVGRNAPLSLRQRQDVQEVLPWLTLLVSQQPSVLQAVKFRWDLIDRRDPRQSTVRHVRVALRIDRRDAKVRRSH